MSWDPQQSYRRPGFRGFSFFPPAIKFLLVSNGAVFLVSLLFGGFHVHGGTPIEDAIIEWFALWPLGSAFFKPWQLISYMFLHSGFTHILFNMFALWMFGVEIENTWGTKKFLTYYFLCGLGGAVAHLILSSTLGSEQGGPLLGASGAVFGILVAFGLLFPNRSIYFFPLFFIPVKAKYFVGIYIAVELFSLYSASDNISHLAHLGGAVTGILYLLVTTGGKIFALRRSRGDGVFRGGVPPQNPWSNGNPQKPNPWQGGGMFNRPRGGRGAVDAEYHDIEGGEHGNPPPSGQSRVITQEEIDRILDKIAATGYQNLTDEERDILFEASRRMEEKR